MNNEFAECVIETNKEVPPPASFDSDSDDQNHLDMLRTWSMNFEPKLNKFISISQNRKNNKSNEEKSLPSDSNKSDNESNHAYT